MIHTVKGFGIVNKAVDVFLELSCFFNDPTDVEIDVYIYIYVCVCVCVSQHLFDICVCVCVCVYIYIYIYIYIYKLCIKQIINENLLYI